MLKNTNIYKPIYKKFLLLKKNVQNKNIKKFLKFRKKKWQNFIKNLLKFSSKNSLQNKRKKFIKFRKKKSNLISSYKIYDIQKHSLRYKSGNRKKKTFKFFLQNKQIFKLYYGNFSKNFIKKTFIKFNSSLNNYFKFFDLVELRLDVILYRTKFALNIRNARQLILHKHLTVNGNVITRYSFILKKGDIIKINKKSQHLIISNLINVNLKPVPLYYLTINYRTLEICLNNIASLFNMFLYFPFWLNFKMLINSYK